MRTQTLISGLKNSQKIRVLVDGVGFYTTVAGTAEICTHKHRVAVMVALQNLAYDRRVANAKNLVMNGKRTDIPVGFGFNYNYTPDGVENIPVSVQVDLV